MLHILSGGSANSPDKYYGIEIKRAEIDEDRLKIEFADGVIIHLWDNGQTCCESRYISCDDDVDDLIGGKLAKIETKESVERADFDGELHEMIFVEVATDKASITLCTHNVHNGQYGGFALTITEAPCQNS
jgi:hypothetical protein